MRIHLPAHELVLSQTCVLWALLQGVALALAGGEGGAGTAAGESRGWSAWTAGGDVGRGAASWEAVAGAAQATRLALPRGQPAARLASRLRPGKRAWRSEAAGLAGGQLWSSVALVSGLCCCAFMAFAARKRRLCEYG